jgi:hypothetical protein
MKIYWTFMVMIAVSVSSGCAIVSYDTKPESAWSVQQAETRRSGTLRYKVNKIPQLTFGGYEGLQEAMQENAAIFKNSERVEKKPEKGLYIETFAQPKDPSTGEMVWGYIALSFWFFLPAYTDDGGFDLRYEVYVDGEKIKTYRYTIYRKGFAWIVMTPLIWINLLTDSEEDAFA